MKNDLCATCPKGTGVIAAALVGGSLLGAAVIGEGCDLPKGRVRKTERTRCDLPEGRERPVEGASDSPLALQFSPPNRARIARGLAPYAQGHQHVGKFRSFIIHYTTEVGAGRPVHDMTYLRVVSPRRRHMLHTGN